ncbi:MAG: hypothetical protein A3G32_09410 [Deltaproteobacteria bacterium RIFCSPLOWO2_12_FULL_40_28]|nr:MAG: hypothetical protein A3C45_07680 [Deltaproteobacteria bacterium RIFCSPHIGHO2_02_FULL_40_28]OGQ20749.1 MAG: hypothetical protein A3E27_07345 [Deltaproteobacteria bacterium RIFCSPHIGHO2_12_FULL_40_32]OGQ41297.1 MAG: hypothetical protein A3I69_04265 [Deltaproteobacteria bacterium RIFCSPLOWO2_02_FULL_40_36]OGQ55361.1 MAG: hypothetical protein A3G32_09410 [Deltaproteobacteria bacterium RIFCSPLOWO2_12_FULL_40_28]
MSSVLIADEILAKLHDALKTKVNEFNYNNWLGQCSWSVKDDVAHVRVPNKFIRDWIVENYLEVVKYELFRITGKEFQIIFQVDHTLQKTEQPKVGVANHHLPSAIPLPQTEEKAPKKHLPEGINSRYTFENFVVGNSNQFVNAACKAVANHPGKNYNPLFIYGGVGLGKTHLLNSITINILHKNPQTKIVFVTGEHFTNEVINSIRYDKTYELRKKYRSNCDLLLIDDVQFLAGKERTMEEFFHTFNALYEGRKQIVMTSDTLPKDIPNLEERLRSRFSWGLLADIQAPDFETRCAILRKKAEDEKIKLPDEVCQYLATHIKSNVRDLEGALIRLAAFSSLADVSLSVDLTAEVLKNMLTGFSSHMTIDKIQESVAHFFNLKISDLKSPRRHKHWATPRQIAMYLCKKHVKASYPEIGQRFGGKDHTTVIHAFQKIEKQLGDNCDIREHIAKIEQILDRSI